MTVLDNIIEAPVQVLKVLFRSFAVDEQVVYIGEAELTVAKAFCCSFAMHLSKLSVHYSLEMGWGIFEAERHPVVVKTSVPPPETRELG